MIRLVLLALTLALSSVPAVAARERPLFDSDEVIHIAIQGPLATIRRSAARSTDSHAATLTLQGTAPESHAVTISARGVSRRNREVCTFPPLWIEFAQRPATASLFRGQRRLKLVTHCQAAEGFQEHALLEYAAYRLLNVLTPLSLSVRLARIDYLEAGASAPFISRVGFLIEDVDQAARRNGLIELNTGDVPAGRLNSEQAARVAVFQYMIGNLDWAMHVGPAGEPCCHNGKLLASDQAATSSLVPIPYDFDFSGLVDAPYAVPPEQIAVNSVRTRRYRGFCLHNEQAQAAAAQARSARPQLESVLRSVPGLQQRPRDRALAFLGGFFADIATPQDVSSNLLRTCLR